MPMEMGVTYYTALLKLADGTDHRIAPVTAYGLLVNAIADKPHTQILGAWSATHGGEGGQLDLEELRRDIADLGPTPIRQQGHIIPQ